MGKRGGDFEGEIEQLLGRLTERDATDLPIQDAYDRERVLLEIFSHCGFNLDRIPRSRKFEVDGAFTATVDGEALRFVIEIKSRARLDAIRNAVRQVERVRREGPFDRALIIVPETIPEFVSREVESLDNGYINLLGIEELRSWLWKNSPAPEERSEQVSETCASIIRNAMRAVANRLAREPQELMTLEWRELEKVLREVFEGMGFDTNLTRSAKDGGFDLSLEIIQAGQKQLYLIEVKHWTTQKPGQSELKKLVRVTAREGATKGILLSSSGFSKTIYQGITEAERTTIGLGGGEKIIALCRSYYRLGTELWTPERSMTDQLLDGLI